MLLGSWLGCVRISKDQVIVGRFSVRNFEMSRSMETLASKVPLKHSEVPSRNISVVSSAVNFFPENEELCLPLKREGTFRNPWNSWRDKRLWDVLRWLSTTKDESNVPRKREELDTLLPMQRVNRVLLEKPLSQGTFRLTWLGHSSVLAQFDGFNILTDPVFSERCSPFQFMGPKRIRPVPCELDDLPSLDAILISHNHYDHLDKNTLKLLLSSERHRNAILVVPLGVKKLLKRLNVDTRTCEQIYELNWWEHVDLDGKLRIFLTPAQHWSRRTIWDTNQCLWGSFAVIGTSVKFYFAGDTGYCPVFKTIGRYLGPFDCAAIPIGAYHPRLVPSCFDSRMTSLMN